MRFYFQNNLLVRHFFIGKNTKKSIIYALFVAKRLLIIERRFHIIYLLL
jgi:hypothetical protein